MVQVIPDTSLLSFSVNKITNTVTFAYQEYTIDIVYKDISKAGLLKEEIFDSYLRPALVALQAQLTRDANVGSLNLNMADMDESWIDTYWENNKVDILNKLGA